MQLSVQFPKLKYIKSVSLHAVQLLLFGFGPSLQILQFSWHLSIVLRFVSLQ